MTTQPNAITVSVKREVASRARRPGVTDLSELGGSSLKPRMCRSSSSIGTQCPADVCTPCSNLPRKPSRSASVSS